MQVGIGPLELLFMFLLSGGFGSGVPQAEDPHLMQLAPAKCLVYSTWAAMEDAAGDSDNATEKLLANTEVKNAIQKVRAGLSDLLPDPAHQKLAQLLWAKAGAVFLEDIQIRARNEAPLYRAAAVMNVGDDAAEIRELLEDIVAKQIPAERVQRENIAGVTFWRFELGENAQPLMLGMSNEYLIGAMGDGVAAGVLERINQPAPAWLVQQRALQTLPRTSSFLHVDLRGLMSLTAEYNELFQDANTRSGFRHAMAAMGFDALDTLSLTSGLDDVGSVTRLALRTHKEARGFLGWFHAPAMTSEDVQLIDAQSPAALVMQFDALKAYDEWLAVIEQLDPTGRGRDAEEIRANVATVEQQLNIRFREDFLGSLGSTARIFAQPGPGGLIMGWTAAVEIKDRARFMAVHEAILRLAQNLLAQAGPNGPSLENRRIAGREVHVLNLERAGVPFSPAWCVTDNEFLLAASTATVQSILEARNAPSIATRPETQSLFAADAETIALFYADTKQVAEVLTPIATQMLSDMMNDPEIQNAVNFVNWSDNVVAYLRPTVWSLARVDQGVELTMRQTLPIGNLFSSAPVAAALLLPAVQASRGAAQRTSGMNNLKQIGLAMHNFHDVYSAFPAGYSADENGKPLLSWRVHVLPFIEQLALYQEFHLDEPWDSPHNKKLIARMPQVYLAPASSHKPTDGLTNYLGVGGRDGVFIRPAKGDRLGARLQNILDGTSNTIMTVETGDDSAVIWTRPADFAPNDEDPVRGLMGLYPGGFQAGFGDGSVQFIAETVDKVILKALFTKSGGEAVNLR